MCIPSKKKFIYLVHDLVCSSFFNNKKKTPKTYDRTDDHLLTWCILHECEWAFENKKSTDQTDPVRLYIDFGNNKVLITLNHRTFHAQNVCSTEWNVYLIAYIIYSYYNIVYTILYRPLIMPHYIAIKMK